MMGSLVRDSTLDDENKDFDHLYYKCVVFNKSGNNHV